MSLFDGELEFADDNAHTGFRLRRLEVLNWGTFDRQVWKVLSDGNNCFLTGDVGSGKSTLVDAVTTLLVPYNKIVFNRAAGSEKQERSFLSYFRGDYKSETGAEQNRTKAVCLRSEGDPDYCGYSVILGYFYNEGYNQGVTLAQLFWLKDEMIRKLFVIGEKDMTIGSDFSGFGGDINLLRKRFKQDPQVEAFSQFKEYNSRFRHLFGIKSAKALDLFNQTISMKAVSSLNEFVRSQMLESSDVAQLIEDLKRNFDNLVRAHDAVLKARRQKDELEPLVAAISEFEGESGDYDLLFALLQGVPAFFAGKRMELIELREGELEGEAVICRNKLEEVQLELEELRDNRAALMAAIQGDRVGQRLRELEEQIRRTEESKTLKQREAKSYSALAESLGYPSTPQAEQFYESMKKGKEEQSGIGSKMERFKSERDELVIGQSSLQRELGDMEGELDSLKRRKSSISKKSLDIRELLCRELSIPEEELPFAGELVRVKEDEAAWEGAVERLLHNFGLSMLVPEEHYQAVSSFVNETNLRGRLVYFRVNLEQDYRPGPVEAGALREKVEFKADSPFYDWLEVEIGRRFSYICCETIEQFYHEVSAITKEGLIKGGKFRHEKDDRRDIHDRRGYILGWSNKEKIKLLEKELLRLKEELADLLKRLERLEKRRAKLQERERSLDFLLKYDNHALINWQKEAEQIEELSREREKLERSSDKLKELKAQLAEVERVIGEKAGAERESVGRLSVLESDLKRLLKDYEDCRIAASSLSEEERAELFPQLERELKRGGLTLENVDDTREKVRGRLESKRERIGREINRRRDRIIKGMEQYKNCFPEDTLEVDASIESTSDFKGFLIKIEEDDLPRHQQRFRELLKVKTIQDVALFRQQLERQALAIEEKIEDINRSLRTVEYNRGSYITLLAQRVTDKDIIQFTSRLAHILEGGLGEGNELYSEEKFSQVKEVLDRLKDEPRWAERVTDVRNWYDFLVIERWKEDDSEKERYSSSSGKSGGQKEKLAYTILAAALAYQFGLEWGRTKSRSFRFVVIDEAFGKGSDESTRYGLELFKKLDLQLLIVTPLQKINIIEGYISNVNLVTNREGNNSVITNMTIEEYSDNRAAYNREKR